MNIERRDAWVRLLRAKSADELADLVDALNLLRHEGVPVPHLDGWSDAEKRELLAACRAQGA